MEKKNANVSPVNKISPRKEVFARRKLGELLLETGLLTGEKLAEALKSQKDSGKRLGQILIEMNLITEEEMAFARARTATTFGWPMKFRPRSLERYRRRSPASFSVSPSL